MTDAPRRMRIVPFRYAETFSAARLRAVTPAQNGQRLNLVLDYDELAFDQPSELLFDQGRVFEHVHGRYVPRCLRFMGVSGLECSGLYAHLDDLPLDHPARSLRGSLAWALPGQPMRWGVFNGSVEPANLELSARRYAMEAPRGEPEAIELTRDWAAAPELPARTFALSQRVHARFGGDPVMVRLHGQPQARRLFVGGQSHQGEQRPAVEAVLNLGDQASRWAGRDALPAGDRWSRKGEGSAGMDVGEIENEARWVAERLEAGQRVLVHCSAGFNRSATICCATLILLEQLTAESALERVRAHHPWCRPDTHHWLALRWLAQATRG
jgi:hypothetical protein